MATPNILDREEYIEQAYFFRTLRDRLAANLPTQEILEGVHEEILSTTRLPLAVQFLATELKHSGLLSTGLALLPHYFTPFQTFVVRQSEADKVRLAFETALLILEREAVYRSGQAQPTGLFIYQFEVISRNRLGYDEGLACMAQDPLYSGEWRAYLDLVRRQLGSYEFGDLIYARSALYVQEQQRHDPSYQPPVPPLFGEKEGKIARANRGRDPLYLFAALQRQLGYPEVPRAKPPDDLPTRFVALQAKLREMETRLKLVESELRGQVDLTQFLGKPELLQDMEDD